MEIELTWQMLSYALNVGIIPLGLLQIRFHNRLKTMENKEPGLREFMKGLETKIDGLSTKMNEMDVKNTETQTDVKWLVKAKKNGDSK